MKRLAARLAVRPCRRRSCSVEPHSHHLTLFGRWYYVHRWTVRDHLARLLTGRPLREEGGP